MYYNMGSWRSSEAPGMVLFRPYLYDPGTGTEGKRPLLTPLTIYPNPARDRVWLQVPESAGVLEIPVYIYDTSGRQLMHSVLRSRELDLSGLSPGLYYIRALISGEMHFSKLLINP
jgi:hypothetical protein